MAVAGVQGMNYGGVGFSLAAFVGEGSKTQGGHFDAIVEGQYWPCYCWRCHIVCMYMCECGGSRVRGRFKYFWRGKFEVWRGIVKGGGRIRSLCDGLAW